MYVTSVINVLVFLISLKNDFFFFNTEKINELYFHEKKEKFLPPPMVVVVANNPELNSTHFYFMFYLVKGNIRNGL